MLFFLEIIDHVDGWMVGGFFVLTYMVRLTFWGTSLPYSGSNFVRNHRCENVCFWFWTICITNRWVDLDQRSQYMCFELSGFTF